MKLPVFFAVTVWTLAFATVCLAASTTRLTVYQGLRFADASITESGKNADVSFFVNRGRRGSMMFESATLGANKIQSFGNERPKRAAIEADTAKWKDYAVPVPGRWYVVEGTDPAKLYLVKVVSFENQGKASAYWKLSLSWEQLK